MQRRPVDPVDPSRPPLVSVIIPAFNTAAYIERAVRSAVRQTCQAIEILVVNDGSTDQTQDIAESLARSEPRIRVLNQPNTGISVARNRAVALARGRYLALLDSDDEWTPTLLERALALLDADTSIGVVTINGWKRGGKHDGQTYWPATSGLRRMNLLDILEREDSVSIVTVFCREVVTKVGAFDETLRRTEDYDLWVRAAAAGFGFVQMLEPLAWLQCRPDSLSADEPAMLASAAKVYRNAAASVREWPAASAAADRQARRFDRERLWYEAKAAVRNGAYPEAAERFDALHDEHGAYRFRILAAAARYAPRQLRWLDRTRRALRQLT
jgi:glycosyltransferase involved in cell wall biosynthesis